MQNRDRLIESRLTALECWVSWEGEGIEQNKKKGLMDTDNSVMVMGGSEAGRGGRGYKQDKWQWKMHNNKRKICIYSHITVCLIILLSHLYMYSTMYLFFSKYGIKI